MPNRGEFDPITSYNFKVEIERVTQSSFVEVEGLESITDVMRNKNGDDLIRHNQVGQTTYTNLILRRRFTNSDDLFVWRQAVIDGQEDHRAGSIIILDKTGDEIMRFNFYEAWPCRWKLGKLSSQTNDLLIEEIEIAIEKVERAKQ
jgi:phage tail-like protein